MRTLLKIFFILYSVFSYGQTNQLIPNLIESNDSIKKSIINHLNSDLQTIAIFSINSYRSPFTINYVLTYDGKNWKKHVIKFRFSSKQDGSIKKKLRKKMPSEQAIKFFKEIDSLGFWRMKIDSLNIAIKELDNGRKELIRITHGATERFEILHDGKYFVRWSYEPEEFQEFLFTSDRQVFIESRKLFLQLFE